MDDDGNDDSLTADPITKYDDNFCQCQDEACEALTYEYTY